MALSSIASINRLERAEKVRIYTRFIPRVIFERYQLPADLSSPDGRSLLTLRCEPGSSDVRLELRRSPQEADPLIFAHLTDTINGQIHVLLYVINDPDAPRFDVDKMPDGTPTRFGSNLRNLPAEKAAMEDGLAPGQIRSGLRILSHSIASFEDFVRSLRHDIYFVEPLFYHNAIIFERYGFAYLKGRRLMEQIHGGFSADGVYARQLDGSSPFRQPWMRDSIRGRSWAIHDGVLGEPFNNVTLYKRVGASAGVETFPDAGW